MSGRLFVDSPARRMESASGAIPCPIATLSGSPSTVESMARVPSSAARSGTLVEQNCDERMTNASTIWETGLHVRRGRAVSPVSRPSAADHMETPGDRAQRYAASSGDRPSFSVASRNAFFNRIAAQLANHLPPAHSRFTARPLFNLMKVAYANERIHYEIAIDLEHRAIEVALHFEDGPVSTLAYLAYLDDRILELKHLLGHQIELERWTASWGRLYELWPLDTLDQAAADRIALRLAEYIRTLQPLVDASGIRPERSAESRGERRGRWRRSSRA